MDAAQIQNLLAPFLAEPLCSDQLNNISIYIDLLLHWNARMNLTAVRDEESIVTRHFGESLFAAHQLLANDQPPTTKDVVDVGSGAGFPGLPIKIFAPDLHVTLIESNNKKATFLREIIRALDLRGIQVFDHRAEEFPADSADLVTLRAVERFDQALPIASRLVCPGGRLALLIGAAQVDQAADLLPSFRWQRQKRIPLSQSRILLTGVPAKPPQVQQVG
jgi:16S rRNA (guanine527-N7)-methyltransferase